ncbi:MAG: hypothetical protein FWD39_03970 [Clostridiales bacterium]|nr:hypothetical protein [Clostridiales bacterium]
MIFLAVTKPKRKADTLLKVMLICLLLGVLLSLFYNLMQAANSLEHFAALDKGYPGEPLIMDGELFGLDELGMWQGLKTAFQIK